MEEMDFAAYTPRGSPLTFNDVMSSPLYQDLMTPLLSEGDESFDFALPRLDRPGEIVRLSDHTGQSPVALIFGSYT